MKEAGSVGPPQVATFEVRCGGGADEAIDASRCFFGDGNASGNRSRSGDELVTGTRLGHLPT